MYKLRGIFERVGRGIDPDTLDCTVPVAQFPTLVRQMHSCGYHLMMTYIVEPKS